MEETELTLLATFKNSLVYTACARQVEALLDENAGGSRASLLLMASFGFLAAIFQVAKKQVRDASKQFVADNTKKDWHPTVETLTAVSIFVLDMLSNLATQMVSSMTAQTVSDAVTGGDNVMWSLLGALICIILLWLLTLTLNNKSKER